MKKLKESYVNLLIIAIISIIIVIGNFIPVWDGVEWIDGYYDVFYALALSYIASLIVYWVTSYLPKCEAKKHTDPIVVRELNEILHCSENVVREIVGEDWNKEKNFKPIDFYNKMYTLYFKTPTKRTGISFLRGDQMSIVESIAYDLNKVEKSIEWLFKCIFYLEPELIGIIGRIRKNNIFLRWPRADEKIIKKLDEVGEGRKLSTNYATDLYKFMGEIQILRSYCEKDIPLDERNLMLPLVLSYQKKDWIELRSITKKIYKSNPTNRSAMYYEAFPYIYEKDYKTAIDMLYKALEHHPNLMFNIRSEFSKSEFEDFNRSQEFIQLFNDPKYINAAS